MKYKHKYALIFTLFVLSSFHLRAQISILSLTATYSENFDGIGASATATLPSGWKVNSATTFSTATNLTTQAGGTTGAGVLTSVSSGGTYNFANGITASSTDRAVGFISSGSFSSPRSLFVLMTNNTGSIINNLNISFDLEKYRSGSRIFNVFFFTSPDGITWTSVPAGDQNFPNDANNATIYNAPIAINKAFSLSGLTIANGSNYYLRWAYTGTGGSTNGQGLGIDNFSVNCCNTATYFYRSATSGNWSNPSTWEVSSNGSTGWTPACSAPTSASAAVDILNGNTVTIDANSSSPDLTIDAGGTLQANNTTFVTFFETGNIINNGSIEMLNSTKAVDVVFTKNGNQSITGTGPVTDFYSIGLNMGGTNGNVLDINSTNFSSSTNLLVNSSGAYTLLNGTIKFSNNYTFANRLFNTVAPTISTSTGIWLNNPNVTITPFNYNYTVSGFLRITSGIFNVGNVSGNSIIMQNSSSIIIEGGTVNVAGRIQAVSPVTGVTYNQSGGTVNLITVGSGSATLSGLELDLTGDNFIMSGGLIVFRNQATAVELYNYATGNVTGGTIQFGDAFSTHINLTGFFINSWCNLPSIVIDNTSGLNPIVQLYHNLTVIGNITIGAGATLNNSYDNATHFIDIYDVYDISLTGNWNNNGTFQSFNSNKVTFNGNSAQFMTGTSLTTFNRLTINNTSGGVTLQTNEYVDSLLTLTSGYVYTSNSSGLLTMNLYSSVAGVSNSSFVNGPVAKFGNTGFVFPVGKDAEYRPIADSALTWYGTFTAEYFHNSPYPTYDSSLHDPTINRVSDAEYWILNRAGTANAFVKLSWDTYSGGVTSLSDLRVARWDGTMWKDHGNGGTTGNTTVGTIKTSALVTSFSPFTLASINAATNPLPIELLNFTVSYNGVNAVNINWETASETNNDYFTIERSSDAIHFSEINKIRGAGNSNQTIQYSTIDKQPLNGVTYYRLKQTDYNGDYKYSNTKSVLIENGNDFEVTNVVSLLSENTIEITITGSSQSDLKVDLFDELGKLIYTSNFKLSETYSKIIIPSDQLSSGIYLLNITGGNKVISKKIFL